MEEETNDMFETAVCIFTVVPDLLVAIEYTEHTAFNLVFISEDSQVGLTASGFLKSLRMVGCTIPVVLLRDGFDGSEELAAQIPQCDADDDFGRRNTTLINVSDAANGDDVHFAAHLRKPFTKRDLCDVIHSTLFPLFHEVVCEHSSIESENETMSN